MPSSLFTFAPQDSSRRSETATLVKSQPPRVYPPSRQSFLARLIRKQVRMSWEINRTNVICGLVALLGILQFAYCVYHAANVTPDGYSISEHFLSDLGRTKTHSGRDNTACADIFNRSVMLLGVSLIPFFSVISKTLEEGRWIVCSSGIFASLGLICIGATPYDKHEVEHYMALGLWICSMLVLVVAIPAVVKLNRTCSAVLVIGTVLVVVAVGAYAFAGSHSRHVVYQKVLAIVAVIWFCVVAVMVSVSMIRSVSSSRLKAERLARRYTREIQRNHRR